MRARVRAGRPGEGRGRPFLDVQRFAQPVLRRSAGDESLHTEQPAGEERRGDDPALPAGRSPDQRVRLLGREPATAGRPLPRQLPRGLAERRRADRVPVLVHRAVEHGHPLRLRPEQLRRNRLDPVGARVRRRRLRVRRVPGEVRDGRVLQVPDRRARRADVPALPVDGHAGQPDADAVLLARRGGDLPPLVEEPLGPTDHNWEENGALPGLAPDPAGVRRAGGPKRPSEQRRDPLLGRLHHARRVVELHLRRPRRRRRAEAGRAVRDRGRPELRPARRRQHPRLDPAAARPSVDQHEGDADEPGRPVGSEHPAQPEPRRTGAIRCTTRRTSATSRSSTRPASRAPAREI